MKTVKNKWGKLIAWGERRLPFIFFEKRSFDGHIILWARWITKKDYNDADKKAKEWFENIKWD